MNHFCKESVIKKVACKISIPSCVDTIIGLRYTNITLSRSNFVPVSFNFKVPAKCLSCSSLLYSVECNISHELLPSPDTFYQSKHLFFSNNDPLLPNVKCGGIEKRTSLPLYHLSSDGCLTILKLEIEAQFNYWLSFTHIMGELVQRKLFRWSINRNWANETLLN